MTNRQNERPRRDPPKYGPSPGAAKYVWKDEDVDVFEDEDALKRNEVQAKKEEEEAKK
jgi:hypothetical protein